MSPDPRRWPAPQRLLRVAVALLFAAGLAALLGHRVLGWDVSAWIAVLPGCPIRAATGIPCPGCGMTRAFLLLAQLRLPEAVAANPASPVLAAAMALQAARPLRWSPPARDAACGVALVALLAVWAARWLPIHARLPL